MEGFETKKALLEYLGKHPKDNKLVDRMMMRGEVYMEDGMYYIAERVEKLKDSGCKPLDVKVDELVNVEKELRDRIRELEEENRKLKEKSDTNPSELEEAKIQWKHYEKLAESRRDLMEKVIHETYVIVKAKLGNKMEEESEFRSSIIERAKGIN